MQRPIPFKFGWLPDVPDQRDIPFRAVFRLPAKVPVRVDLRKNCPPVEQQGNLGSCTAQALIGSLEFLELRELAEKPESGRKFCDLSRLFVYYNERAAMGTIGEDSGAMLRTGIKVLKTMGVCKELTWPYIISRFTQKPSRKCYLEGKNHQVTSYQRLSSLPEMKACLAMGHPFVFGFAVYEHVMSKDVRKSGIIQMPARNERMIGGHAVMAIGYDDRSKTVYFRNSWGSDWGDSGYGSLPYGYVESRELSDDFWCIQATESNLFAHYLAHRTARMADGND